MIIKLTFTNYTFLKVSPECKESALNILRVAMGRLEKDLDHVLSNHGKSSKKIYEDMFINKIVVADSLNLDRKTKESWLNKMKMATYLLCQIMELFEANETSGGSDLFMSKKGRGRSKSQASTGQAAIWDLDTKLNSVALIYRVLQLNLALLFDPPVVEREFVDAVAACLFRFLENPTIAHVR